jgi:hypothetical protein
LTQRRPRLDAGSLTLSSATAVAPHSPSKRRGD